MCVALKVFRLVSMWLNNESNDELNGFISGVIAKIASHKFLIVIPQLCARLNSDNNRPFEKNLEKVFMASICYAFINYYY